MATKKKATKKVAEPKTIEPEITEEVKTEEVVKEEPKSDVIGSIKGGKQVHQSGFVKFKAVRGPINKRELPADIQRWLTNKGYGTNIYLQSKEYLEKKKVDLEMVEKLKKFISDRYV